MASTMSAFLLVNCILEYVFWGCDGMEQAGLVEDLLIGS